MMVGQVAVKIHAPITQTPERERERKEKLTGQN